MKPLATLYVTRKKLYIRECEEGEAGQTIIAEYYS